MGGRHTRITALAVTVLALAGAPAAHATFHLMSVREVYPGSSGSATAQEAEYVELQMYSAGQNFVQGHTITVYNASGSETGSATFAADMAKGTNQSTLLAATPAAATQFGMTPDATLSAGSLNPIGGAACWESLDCVAWGNFKGSVLAPVGTPADPAGIPDGMALQRTIARNCPTLLEQGDDSDDSSLDFLNALPTPRPNSIVPPEHACASQAPDGGGSSKPGAAGGGQAAGRRPQTSIRRGPPHVSRRRSATFRFTSSQPNSTFLCRLDGRLFKRCHSPLTLRHLKLGQHLFRVKARAPGGATDRSAAVWSFRVLARR
jgi:hypothetical protein